MALEIALAPLTFVLCFAITLPVSNKRPAKAVTPRPHDQKVPETT
jgi:hypothetical protein